MSVLFNLGSVPNDVGKTKSMLRDKGSELRLEPRDGKTPLVEVQPNR